ncbi:hypothetical protein M758_UG128000, partial [Ceratodon purpureus]
LLNEAHALGAESDCTLDYTTTHVITFRPSWTNLDPKNILRSLGDKEVQQIVTLSPFWHPKGEKIKVVYHDWLVDCITAGSLLPVEPYLAM